MKNVQYYLNKLNLDKLVDEYYCRIKNSLLENEGSEESLKDLILITKLKIKEYINKLQNLPIKEGKPENILLSYEGYLYGLLSEPVFSLVHIKEILETKDLTKINIYAYELSSNEEIMGYLVSNSEYTQNHLYELMTDVLYEASFFGYEEDKKYEVRQELKDALKEIEEGVENLKSYDEFKEKYLSDIYTYKPDSIQEELKHKIMKDIQEFNKYSLTKELSNLKKELEINYGNNK